MMRQHDGPQYRETVELPDTLLNNVSVWLEEGLYSQAFSLLTNTLTAGTGTPRPAHVPPARFFALAATLAVHPSMTTRSKTKEKHIAADDAIRYLRLTEKLVGSEGASLREAFQFGRSEDLRAQRARFRKSHDLEDKPVEKLRCIYTSEKQSLWDRAESFWSLLGWAMNCSVVEPRRWTRWHLLLSMMLDTMENDLQQAILEHTPDVPESSQLSATALDDTLIVQYLNTVDGGRKNKRLIMRAVLADGTAKALGEFGQIWENETAEPKQATKGRKRSKLNIDKGQYGDYDDDSNEELARPVLSLEPVRQLVPCDTAYNFTNEEATSIRTRVLALLTTVCNTVPEAFLSAEDLFDIYAEFLKPLPVNQFQDVAIRLGAMLDENSQSSLYQMLLRASIDSAAPVYNQNELTQEDFERHFAPFAANSSSLAENAKVSLLVEGLLRLLWKHELLEYTEQLSSIVTQGIQARKERASQGDQDDMQCLHLSSERMLAVLKMLQESI